MGKCDKCDSFAENRSPAPNKPDRISYESGVAQVLYKRCVGVV